jgi:hypothetical protein
VIVPLLSLWNLLFHPGLYAYADQHFPLSSEIPPYYIISTNPLNGFAFDRIFITWPFYIFSLFTNSIAIAERLFLYYTFFLYSVLCYVFATLAVNFYSEKIHALSLLERNGGKLAIFIVEYSNLSALNLNADGGTWSDSIILILVSISIILILRDNLKLRTYFIISGLMILSFLLDPDYVPMFWLAVFVVSVFRSVIEWREFKRIAFSVLSIIISSISLIYLYLQALLFGPLTVSGFNALGYRDYSPGTVAFLSSNITPYNVLILFGHLWSTIVYAPPSIIFARNIFNLPSLYNPPQIIVVPGIMYYIWLIALASIPVVAFSTVLLKSTRKVAIPVLMLFIVAYLVTQEWNFKIIYNSLHLLISIPVFGSAIGTSLSLPGHFINLLAFTYLPLFAFGVLTIIFYSSRIHFIYETEQQSSLLKVTLEELFKAQKGRKREAKTFVSIVIIVLLVSLAGWQAFNGSYYPMRASPGSFLLGNSVEPKGVFSPTVINESVINAYDIVVSNYRNNYNTLWIGGPSINEFTFAGAPNNVAEGGLAYLTTNHLWYDVIPYLESHSVRFVVVSNEDIANTVPDPFSIYGFHNYSQANTFFKQSGLNEVYSEWNVSVYELHNINSPIYYSNILLNSTGAGTSSSVLYKLFNIMG